MHYTSQTDFDFVADLPTGPATPRGRRARRPAPVNARPANAAIPVVQEVRLALDAETLANQLELHPDYRVLRRLKPCWHWPSPATDAPSHQLVLLDVETTGLDAGRDRIIELALLRVGVDAVTGMPVGEVQVYDGLEDPGIPISAEITRLTGITEAMVRGQRIDEDRVAQLLAGADLVVAHNAAFDRPFVEARLPAAQELSWACSLNDIDWRAQGAGSARLESLALDMGLFYDAHRAETDCHALLAVLAAPLPQGLLTGIGRLLERARCDHYRLQANGAPFEAKDALKARGYRWNAEQRVWSAVLASDAALEDELLWLAQSVYQGRGATLQCERLNARTRYSRRSGELFVRQL